MSSARGRTLNHMKYLAALSASAVAAACAGRTINDANHDGIPDDQQDSGPDAYGVVDPIPRPSCFNSNGLPTVAAAYTNGIDDAGTDASADGGADASADGGDDDASAPPLDAGGGRLVAVTFKFEKATQVVFGSTATSTDAAVVESMISGSAGRVVLAVPEGQTDARVTLYLSCTGADPSTLTIYLKLGPTSVTATAGGY